MFLGVTGMLMPMPYTKEQRQKLADTVRRTRLAKQLDKEPAARAAKVNSITWKRVEDAEGVRDASLSKILASLGLSLGDVFEDQKGWARVLDSRPDPIAPVDYPAKVLEMSNTLWQAVTDLADSPDEDPRRYDKAERAVVAAADLLVDVLLALNAGPASKGLIQEMTNTAYEILDLDQEEDDDVSIVLPGDQTPEPNASETVDEDKEDGLDKAQRRPAIGRPGGRLRSEGAGEDGADDADYGH